MVAQLLINFAVVFLGGVSDFKKREIPNIVPVTLFITGFLFGRSLSSSTFSCIITIAVLLLAGRVSKSNIPGGDFKLLTALSFSHGIVGLLVILILSGIAMLSVSPILKLTLKTKVPLCTYVALAYAIFSILVVL